MVGGFLLRARFQLGFVKRGDRPGPFASEAPPSLRRSLIRSISVDRRLFGWAGVGVIGGIEAGFDRGGRCPLLQAIEKPITSQHDSRARDGQRGESSPLEAVDRQFFELISRANHVGLPVFTLAVDFLTDGGEARGVISPSRCFQTTRPSSRATHDRMPLSLSR